MNKTIFIDRDGVINQEIGYLHTIIDFKFIDGIFAACKDFLIKKYQIIIITNQSGIGRGYYSKNDFYTLNNWMLQQFDKENIKITDVFFCPHTPNDNCNCRKPKIGMFEDAQKKYKIDKNHSWMIGDKEDDIQAANNFGITNTILMESGHKINKNNSNAKFILKSIKQISAIIL